MQQTPHDPDKVPLTPDAPGPTDSHRTAGAPSRGFPWLTALLAVVFLAAIAGIAWLGVGYSSRPTIARIVEDPLAYEGQEITLTGTAVKAVSIPLVGGGFVLQDRNGNALHVLSREVPATNSEVTVAGTIDVPVTVGDKRVVYLKATDVGPRP